MIIFDGTWLSWRVAPSVGDFMKEGDLDLLRWMCLLTYAHSIEPVFLLLLLFLRSSFGRDVVLWAVSSSAKQFFSPTVFYISMPVPWRKISRNKFRVYAIHPLS
jgi:hypothetical protein